MEEKALKIVINYVLGIYKEDKKTIESCKEVNTLFINMVKNEETKLDRLLNSFPEVHPVASIYSEIRDREDLLQLHYNCLRKVKKYLKKQMLIMNV